MRVRSLCGPLEVGLSDSLHTCALVPERGRRVYGRLQAERGLRDGRACGHGAGSLGAVDCLWLMWSVRGIGDMGVQVLSSRRLTCGGSSFSLPFTVYVGKEHTTGVQPICSLYRHTGNSA